MEVINALYILVVVGGIGVVADPTISCPVPVSPRNGQVILQGNGQWVIYACDPGYYLIGPRTSRCVDKAWTGEPPLCRALSDADLPLPPDDGSDSEAKKPRPLFKWDDSDDGDANKTVSDEQSDEARLQMILYPRRQQLAVQRVRSAAELEEEEKRRNEQSRSSQRSVPSVIYVRRPVGPYKSQGSRAALHAVEGDYPEDVQFVHVPPVMSNDKGGGQSDDYWRQVYWMTHYANPRQAAMAYTNAYGYPVSMTLTESQMAWINSLHPELRDRYLRDLYSVRVPDDSVRAQEFLRRYGDTANWYYNNAYYMRQPVAVTVDDPVSTYDYSCHQTGDDGRVTLVRAPSLRSAYIHRYDRRRNPNSPHNDYLAAMYRCRAGYRLADTRASELYCSRRGWVGSVPYCVPRS